MNDRLLRWRRAAAALAVTAVIVGVPVLAGPATAQDATDQVATDQVPSDQTMPAYSTGDPVLDEFLAEYLSQYAVFAPYPDGTCPEGSEPIYFFGTPACAAAYQATPGTQGTPGDTSAGQPGPPGEVISGQPGEPGGWSNSGGVPEPGTLGEAPNQGP